MKRHILSDQHKEHLGRVGVRETPEHLDIHPEEYAQDYAHWKRTLPQAGHEVLHMKALAHAAWRRQAQQDHDAAKQQTVIHKHEHSHKIPGLILLSAILLILALCVVVPQAHCQFSHINTIQTKNGGSGIGFHASPFIINCSTNMTCTDDGTTLTVTASSSAGTAWSGLTAPGANLALTMGAFTTTWTYNAATGANVNLLVVTDTTNNSGTGYLLEVNTASGSAAKPFGAFALGTANGIQVDATGTLAKVGTGHVNADQCSGAACGTVTSIATTSPITGGTITGTGTIACPSCLTSVTAHNLLSATHGDTVAHTVVLGDVIFGNSTPAWGVLAGNTTSTLQFLSQTGTGSVSAAPAWHTPACGDLSNAAASCSTDATNAANISSGTLPAARLPNPSASTLGGVESKDCTGTGHVLKINTDGTITCSADSGGGGSGRILGGSFSASQQVGASSTSNAFPDGYLQAAGSSEAARQMASPVTCTVGNLYVTIGSAQSGTGSIAFNFRKNAANCGPSVTIAAGAAAGTYSDTTNTCAVTAGDLMSIQIVNSATASGAVMNGLLYTCN